LQAFAVKALIHHTCRAVRLCAARHTHWRTDVTPNLTHTPERFDGNTVSCSGAVTRIWSRASGDIFIRLALDAPEGLAGDPSSSPRLTLRLPDGRMGGQDISLMKGDRLQVAGYLSDYEYWETLRDFLIKARRSGLAEHLPELAEAAGARVRRVMTNVVPEQLVCLPPGEAAPCNDARLDGLVVRIWPYGGHLFARLAVYDRQTVCQATNGKGGRPRRVPHYVTILFPAGQAGERPVRVRQRDRIRVSGQLGSRLYTENLRTFLINAGQAGVLARLGDGNAPDHIWTTYARTCLVARTLIQYTRKT
jgi:hypothetical protein